MENGTGNGGADPIAVVALRWVGTSEQRTVCRCMTMPQTDETLERQGHIEVHEQLMLTDAV